MRYIALSVGLLGLFILYSSFLGSPSLSNSLTKENTVVVIEGEVLSQRLLFEETSLLVLENYEILCTCDRSYKGKFVHITGIVESYENRKQVRAYTIRIVDTPSS